MAGIYIAAIITTVLAALIYGSFAFVKSKVKDWPWYIAAIIIHIPVYFAAFYWYRLPLDSLITRFIQPGSGLHLFIAMTYAPLTEEPAKWLLLPVAALVMLIAKRKTPAFSPIRMALAVGLGFGIGEMWLIAQNIASVPEYASIPWYMFTGFISERFMVCFVHGAFASVVWTKLGKGFGIVGGMLFAMFLHYTGNFPIYLKVIDLGGLDDVVWVTLLSGYVIVFYIAMIAMVVFLTFGKAPIGSVIYGRAKCPGCGGEYNRPYLALMFKDKRLERCPHCGKTNKIGEEDVIGED